MTPAYGECVISHRYDDDGMPAGVWIEEAPPRILASPELLNAIEDNKTGWPATLEDGILKIRGINRTVIYRITGRVLNGDNWRDPCVVMEWPD